MPAESVLVPDHARGEYCAAGHKPPEGILASEEATTVVTLVIPLFRVDTLMMPLQVRLADKFLGATLDKAWEWILAFFVMSF